MFCLCFLLGILWYHVLYVFKPISYFEFIFVHSVRLCSNFIDLHATVRPRNITLNHLFNKLFTVHIFRKYVTVSTPHTHTHTQKDLVLITIFLSDWHLESLQKILLNDII